MYYTSGGIEEFVKYVDYCCADQISKLQLITMAREFKLEVEGCSIWQLDVSGENNGLREI